MYQIPERLYQRLDTLHQTTGQFSKLTDKKLYIKCKVYIFCKEIFVYLHMFIIEQSTGKKHKVIVEPVISDDYKTITKKRYFFNWKTEKKYEVYKLRRTDSDTILGLISFINYAEEKRIEIKLLGVSIENRGTKKQYERIAGTLIGFACREAMKCYGIEACVSLVPKTEIKAHYIIKYEMMDAGKQIFLEGLPLLKMLNNYEL